MHSGIAGKNRQYIKAAYITENSLHIGRAYICIFYKEIVFI